MINPSLMIELVIWELYNYSISNQMLILALFNEWVYLNSNTINLKFLSEAQIF